MKLKEFTSQCLDVIQFGLNAYWTFMSAHWIIGFFLTVALMNTLVNVIKALRGTPSRNEIRVIEPAPVRTPPPPEPRITRLEVEPKPPAISRMDRILKDEDP